MLLVETYLAPSQIEGLGVFARRAIPKGAEVWRLDLRYDRLIARGDYEEAPEPMRSYLDRYAYPHTGDPGFLILDADEGRFMNHSGTPNCDFSRPGTGVALRDIAAGEEMTCDYGSFFDEPVVMLGTRHQV